MICHFGVQLCSVVIGKKRIQIDLATMSYHIAVFNADIYTNTPVK